MGEDTEEAAQLMQCASRYAARCVYPTYGQPVLMHARKDEWLEAGPLLLAQGGVCALGDWDKYNRAEKLGYNIRAGTHTHPSIHTLHYIHYMYHVTSYTKSITCNECNVYIFAQPWSQETSTWTVQLCPYVVLCGHTGVDPLHQKKNTNSKP